MMSPEKRQVLQQKKEQLQRRIAFEAFLGESVIPFMEVLDTLQNLKISFKVVLLRCIPMEFKDLLLERFRTETFVKYNLSDIEISTDDIWIEQLLDSYPNMHPLRYVPDFPLVGSRVDVPSMVLSEILDTHHLASQNVYLCYLKYAFLLEINLQALAQNVDEEVFNIWQGDAVIFPKDLSWLIAYSLEEEWRFGIKNHD